MDLDTSFGRWLRHRRRALFLHRLGHLPDCDDGVDLLLAQRRYEEARKVAEQARHILAATLSEDHWQVAMAMNAEGADMDQLLLKYGKLTRWLAEKYHRKA